jgi:retinol dehydrogenase 12
MLKTAEEYSTTPRLVVTSSEVHYWCSLHKHKAVLDSKTPLKVISSEVYTTKA